MANLTKHKYNMDMDEDTLKLIKTFEHAQEAHIMEVSCENVNINTGAKSPSYKMCSACYCIINQTWDHQEWCALFEQEAVTKWIEDGTAK
jgi:hypothetical protein